MRRDSFAVPKNPSVADFLELCGLAGGLYYGAPARAADKKERMHMRTRKGFTIVELVVVIAVIAILAAVLIPTFSGVVEKTDRNTALKLAEAAYKEARAAEIDKGGSFPRASEEVDGFVFVISQDGATDSVFQYPSEFEYAVEITNKKVSLGDKLVTANPDGNYVNTTPATGVTLHRDSITLEVGQTELLHAAVQPANAANKNVVWSSSHDSIVTVDANGMIKGIRASDTAVTITAKSVDGNYTATCAVTVKPVSVNFVSLNALNMSFTLGDVGRQLTATVKPVNAANQTVTWRSDNPNVAEVNDGFVTLVGPGYTEIVATSANNISAKCGITVNGLKLGTAQTEIEVGDMFAISAAAYPAGKITWSSNNGCVSVNDFGVVTAHSTGTATISATVNGFVETCEITVKAAEGGSGEVTIVPSITLDKTAIGLTKDATYTINATVANASGSVSWSSSDNTVATVEGGSIKAMASGEALITASIVKEGNTYTATCVVHVAESATPNVTSIALDKTAATIVQGETINLTAAVAAPEGVDQTVTWETNRTNIATVANGEVTGVAPGTATITAIAGDHRVTCEVTVLGEYSVTVDATEEHILFGGVDTVIQGETYTAILAANDNCVINEVTVEINGVETTDFTRNEKTITIPNVQGNVVIIVSSMKLVPTPVEGVTIDETLTLDPEETHALGATVVPDGASNKAVTWHSSNTNVASVNADGVVTAHNAGTAVITVTTVNGGFTDTCLVTVTGNKVESIALDKSAISIEVGKTDTLTATVDPDNATNKNVIWKSNNPVIATVENGLVTGVSAGTATIVAITEDGNHIAACMVTVTAESNVAVYSVSFAADSGQNIDIKSRTAKEGDNYTLVLEAYEGYVITEYTATVDGRTVAHKSDDGSHSRVLSYEIGNVSGDIIVTARAEKIIDKSYYESGGNIVATNYMLIDLEHYDRVDVSWVQDKNIKSMKVYLCDLYNNVFNGGYTIVDDNDSDNKCSFYIMNPSAVSKVYMCLRVEFLDEINPTDAAIQLDLITMQ